MRDGRQPPPDPRNPYFAGQLADADRRLADAQAAGGGSFTDLPGTGLQPNPVWDFQRCYSVLSADAAGFAAADAGGRYAGVPQAHAVAEMPVSPGSPRPADSYRDDQTGLFGPGAAMAGTPLVESTGNPWLAPWYGGTFTGAAVSRVLPWPSPTSDALLFRHDEPGILVRSTPTLLPPPYPAQAVTPGYGGPPTLRMATAVNPASGEWSAVPVTYSFPASDRPAPRVWRWCLRANLVFTGFSAYAVNSPRPPWAAADGFYSVSHQIRVTTKNPGGTTFQNVVNTHRGLRYWKYFNGTADVDAPPVVFGGWTEGFVIYGTACAGVAAGGAWDLKLELLATGGLPNPPGAAGATNPYEVADADDGAEPRFWLEAWPLDYCIPGGQDFDSPRVFPRPDPEPMAYQAGLLASDEDEFEAAKLRAAMARRTGAGGVLTHEAPHV